MLFTPQNYIEKIIEPILRRLQMVSHVIGL